MASIHQKAKDGTWYISFRQEGKLKHRSLATTSKRKALELKREIELMLEECSMAEVIISDKPRTQFKNPHIEDFWEAFNAWAQEHRAKSTVDEYKMWFERFTKYTGMPRLGDSYLFCFVLLGLVFPIRCRCLMFLL